MCVSREVRYLALRVSTINHRHKEIRKQNVVMKLSNRETAPQQLISKLNRMIVAQIMPQKSAGKYYFQLPF